ncbi:hypothetical protein [Nocardia barduliensis]|uniref:hypothetical protein n=1 Tax=Nocardia barduliensis TaxID=2736643 RepID=UPI001574C51C|nr:hypothetical protein [Nocardia barduliensis]
MAAELTPSDPMTRHSRSATVPRGKAHGPAAGLELVDALVAAGALGTCHLRYAVRGDLLAQPGRYQ